MGLNSLLPVNTSKILISISCRIIVTIFEWKKKQTRISILYYLTQIQNTKSITQINKFIPRNLYLLCCTNTQSLHTIYQALLHRSSQVNQDISKNWLLCLGLALVHMLVGWHHLHLQVMEVSLLFFLLFFYIQMIYPMKFCRQHHQSHLYDNITNFLTS